MFASRWSGERPERVTTEARRLESEPKDLSSPRVGEHRSATLGFARVAAPAKICTRSA
ncbi:MAG: hypothetical protein ACRECR_05780 [Thermoplasmata archaeon]